MNIKELLNVIHIGLDFDSNDSISDGVKFISKIQELKDNEKDVLIAIFEYGPLYDGDVPSKSGRDILLCDGFASKVVVKGEEGFNACTYNGARAYRLIKYMQNLN